MPSTVLGANNTMTSGRGQVPVFSLAEMTAIKSMTTAGISNDVVDSDNQIFSPTSSIVNLEHITLLLPSLGGLGSAL